MEPEDYEPFSDFLARVGIPEEGIKGTHGPNRGKKYARRSPSRTEGGWRVWPADSTYDQLLSLKSWVAFGVWRWHAKEAAIRGWSEDSRAIQREIAKDVGCTDRQVRTVYKQVEALSLFVPGTFAKKKNKKEIRVRGFEVYGYQKAPQCKPDKPRDMGN